MINTRLSASWCAAPGFLSSDCNLTATCLHIWICRCWRIGRSKSQQSNKYDFPWYFKNMFCPFKPSNKTNCHVFLLKKMIQRWRLSDLFVSMILLLPGKVTLQDIILVSSSSPSISSWVSTCWRSLVACRTVDCSVQWCAVWRCCKCLARSCVETGGQGCVRSTDRLVTGDSWSQLSNTPTHLTLPLTSPRTLTRAGVLTQSPLHSTVRKI